MPEAAGRRPLALRFALRFAIAFAVALLLYPRLLPAWQRMVLGTANAILAPLHPPTFIEAEGDGGWRSRILGTEGWRDWYRWKSFVVHLELVGIALLPALLVATPAGIKEQARMFALALPMLFLSQVLAAVGLVRFYLCLWREPDSLVCATLLRLAYASGQLSAVSLWALVSWPHLLPLLPGAGIGAAGRGGKPRRNDPCPCGSGRKHKHCCGREGGVGGSQPG